MSKLKNVKVLTISAMLLAMAIILGFFKISIGNLIEIKFSSLPIAMSAYLFGPFVGALVGLLSDIGTYLVHPTGPFFIGFSISTALTGAIFGFMLYHQDISLRRILLSELIITGVVHLGLNTLWLSMLYGKAFIAIISTRLLKEIIMYPINTFLLTMIIKPVGKQAIVKAGK